MKILVSCAVAATVCAGSFAHAATFSADTASASSFFDGSYLPSNTIDGSGLPGGFGPSDIHADYAVNNHWTTDGTNPTEEWIEWTFINPQTVGGIYIWNHLSNIISSNSQYEPTVFDLTLEDGSGNAIFFFDDVSLTPDTAGASESFTFTAPVANVYSVLFEVEQTQGSPNYTGLAEVLFDDSVIAGADVTLSTIPLPAAAWMLLAGIGGLAGARRLRR